MYAKSCIHTYVPIHIHIQSSICLQIHTYIHKLNMHVCIYKFTYLLYNAEVGGYYGFLLLYFYYCHLLLYFYCCHLLLYFYYYYLLYFYNYHLLLYYYHLLLSTTINLFLCRSGWVLWFVLCVHVCMCMSLIICTCANLPYNAGMQGGEVV